VTLARHYAYCLTPQGFAEKSRLTVQCLSNSFSFVRLVKSDCARLLGQAKGKGFSRPVLAGQSDLAKVAILCAGVAIIAVVDPASEVARLCRRRCLLILRRGDEGVRRRYRRRRRVRQRILTMRPRRCKAGSACSRRACSACASGVELRKRGMSEAVGNRWCVVQTQVNGEAKAAQSLLRQGYEICLPRHMKFSGGGRLRVGSPSPGVR
jgi:hypothetical protein